MWHYTQWPIGTCLVFIIKVVTTSRPLRLIMSAHVPGRWTLFLYLLFILNHSAILQFNSPFPVFFTLILYSVYVLITVRAFLLVAFVFVVYSSYTTKIK